MKKILLISCLMILNILSILKAQTSDFKSFTNKEFKQEIQKAEVICLDVRTAKEYADGHIKEVDFNIDLLSKTFLDEALNKLDKTKTIAVYCRSGHRSKKAAAMLSQKGYKVVELDKGIKGWLEEGYPLVK